MAIVWGNGYRTQFGTILYCGLDVSVSGSTVMVTAYWKANAGYSISVAHAQFHVAGSHTYAAQVALNGGGEAPKRLWSTSFSVNRQHGTPTYGTLYASISGYGGVSNVTANFTVAALPYSDAAAPSYLNARLVSDSQAVLDWAATDSATAPVAGFNLYRTIDKQMYQKIAVLPKDARQYTDSSLPGPDHRIHYDIRTITASGGETEQTNAPYIYTSPATPMGLYVSRDGSDVILTWTNAARWARQVEIWDGNRKLDTVEASTYRVIRPSPSQSHTYKVRAVIGNAYSPFTSSKRVQLLTAPLAPTGLTPSGGYNPSNEAVNLAWVHNPTDATGQSRYEIQYRYSSGYSWQSIGTQNSSRASHSMNFGANSRVEWRVRTWGQDPDKPSPWSNTSVFEQVYRPSIQSVTPAAYANVTDSDATFTVDASISGYSWRAEVVHKPSGARHQLVTGYASGTQGAGKLTRLENGAQYELRVTITGRVSSRTWVSTFTVSYLAPPAPQATTAWNSETAALVFTVTPKPGQIQAEKFELWKGEECIDSTPAAGVNPRQLTDKIPAVAGGDVYHVRAVAHNGAYSVWNSPPAVPCPVKGIWLTWGENQAYTIMLRYNPGLETNTSRAVVEQEFAGYTHPRVVFGDLTSHVTNISGLLTGGNVYPVDGAGQAAMLENSLAITDTPIYLRTPRIKPRTGYVKGVRCVYEIWGGVNVSLAHVEAVF